MLEVGDHVVAERGARRGGVIFDAADGIELVAVFAVNGEPSLFQPLQVSRVVERELGHEVS